MSFAVGLYSQNVALQRELAERPTTATNDELDKGFSDIYTTIGLISSRYRVIADTHMRTQHYAKPHTTPQHLCPECGDLRRVMREGIVWVPAARLKLLRAMERTSAGMPADMFVTNDPPDPLIDVVEELDSVLFLLKTHASFSYTLLQAEIYTNHYSKKHAHPVPGLKGFGDCPECIALYEKQMALTQPISKARYETLLQVEKTHVSSGRTLHLLKK